jgi:hypothetical protein
MEVVFGLLFVQRAPCFAGRAPVLKHHTITPDVNYLTGF